MERVYLVFSLQAIVGDIAGKVSGLVSFWGSVLRYWKVGENELGVFLAGILEMLCCCAGIRWE